MTCLLLNRKIKIVIAEPWDFSSTDGDNIIFAKVVMKKKYGAIAETLSEFEGSTKYLLLVKRGDGNAYNIYGIDGRTNLEGMEVGDKKDFLFIGSI